MKYAKTLTLDCEASRAAAHRYVDEAPPGATFTIGEERRTAAQNRKLWPMLHDFADQVPLNGVQLDPEDMKNALTASFRHCDLVEGFDGRLVAVGLSTSSMGKTEFSEFIEFIYAMGTEYGVRWSEEALKFYMENSREAQ